MESAVGFYWTRPVKWADFRFLPKDAEAAAHRSKTIRYQMEIVRQWTTSNAFNLVYEIPYIDKRTDRATDGCKVALERARAKCSDRGAWLIYVDFAGERPWRQNPYIREYSEQLGFRVRDLPAAKITIDGVLFDPFEHFEMWRDLDKKTRAGFRENVDAALLEAYLKFAGFPSQYARIADDLNRHGIKTSTGQNWTDENARKAIKKRMGQC